MIPDSPHTLHRRLTLHSVEVPRAARTLSRVLVVILVITAVALVLTPWQQTIPGSGRLVAFDPSQRLQQVQATVDGRIDRWHVVEGQRINRGDPIVDLTDNDPDIMRRLREEREAVQRTIDETESRSRSLGDRIVGLDETLRTSVEAAALREQMARERVTAAEQALTAARAARVTADLNLERQRALDAKGLTSTRNVELAVLEATTRVAEVDRAVATLNAARSEQASLSAELARTRADARTRIDEARASLASANSDVAKGRAEMAKLDVRIARQSTQRVVAPVDGTVLRVVGRQSGELMKAGEPLATIVPASTNDVVELWVNGNDMPMVMPGQLVRLQFEGWPALQFSGWPSIAVGTFGGRVLLVDSTDNGKGRFRVLVEQDKADDPWPSQRFLRQGVRANGWVMLNIVPIGFELWRQFNGFPPVLSPDEPPIVEIERAAEGAKDDKGGK